MSYVIQKTQLSDVIDLPLVEQSAGRAFKSIPSLAWLADDSVMSVDEHKRLLASGFSWVAFDTLSGTNAGFITAEIIEGDFYVGEVSVGEAHQRKGIGSKLFQAALTEARSLGVQSATLTTFIDVPWNAPYYEKLGFVILKSGMLPPYLQRILQAEKAAGLPLDRRCAMRITL